MTNPLNGTNLYALLLLLRSGSNQALVVVEGPSDSLTLAPHLDRKAARPVVGYGRASVEEAMTLADSTLKGVVGLADLDIDHLVGLTTLRLSNLVRSKHYDLEADIIFTEGIVDRIIYAYVDRSIVEAGLRIGGHDSPLSVVKDLSYPVGELRRVSRLNEFGLFLRELPLGVFITRDLQLNIEKLSHAIHQKSSHTSLTRDDVETLLKKADTVPKNVRNYSVCCGHDMLSILGGLLTQWGARRVSYDETCAALRTTLSRGDLENLHVFKDLSEWARRNGERLWSAA